MAIGDPYLTRALLKDVLLIAQENTEEDNLIDRALAGAAKAIERRSGWPTFWNTETPVERTFSIVGKVAPVRGPQWNYLKVLLRWGIASKTGFSLTGVTANDLLDADALEEGRPFDAIRISSGASFGQNGTLTGTAVWGWPEVPADVILANQLQAHRFYNRRKSPEGIAGSAEWGITRIPPLDPDVLSILKGGGLMRAGIG